MDTLSTLNFPVLRGIQAGQEYYATMWTLRMLRQVSIFDETELPPELRAQRILNKARIPEIAHYILDNPKNYVFSALTVSIDSEVEFVPLSNLPGEDRLGILKVPTEARFIISDGQHRRAAILSALEQKPELGNETISVVFFLDIGLERSQQMFADLNRYAIRPSRSLGLLYDHRNDKAKLAKLVVLKSSVFRDIVDMEKNSLAPRSRKLFTLSALYNACADLVADLATGHLDTDADLAREYWETVAKHFQCGCRCGRAACRPASCARGTSMPMASPCRPWARPETRCCRHTPENGSRGSSTWSTLIGLAPTPGFGRDGPSSAVKYRKLLRMSF